MVVSLTSYYSGNNGARQRPQLNAVSIKKIYIESIFREMTTLHIMWHEYTIKQNWQSLVDNKTAFVLFNQLNAQELLFIFITILKVMHSRRGSPIIFYKVVILAIHSVTRYLFWGKMVKRLIVFKQTKRKHFFCFVLLI